MKRQLSISEKVHPYVEVAPPLHNYPSAESQAHQDQEKGLIGHPIVANNELGFNQDAGPATKQRRRRRCLVRCCCCIGACVGTFFAIVGILVLVFFLVLHPKLPKYTVTEASISKFSMSNSSSGGGGGSDVANALIAVEGGDNGTVYLNVDMELTARMRNPNKKIGIDYREIRGTLLYEGVDIGQGSIPAFYQGHKNTTYISLTLQGRNIALTPSLASSLKNTLNNDDSIVLHARAITLVRLKIGRWRTHTSKVRVKCTIELTNPTRGTVRLLHDSCKFKLLRLHL